MTIGQELQQMNRQCEFCKHWVYQRDPHVIFKINVSAFVAQSHGFVLCVKLYS